MLEILETKDENLDTLNRYFSDVRFDVLFQYNAGAYGSIKSWEIDKISNDSIRAKMADIYEFLISRTEKILENLSGSGPIENALVEKLTNRVITTLPNGEKVIRGKITDAKIIFGEEFLHLIQLHKNNTCVTRSRIESLFPIMDELIVLIDEELKITAE